MSLPKVPDHYHLVKGFISTFDLDENLLATLINKEDIDKYLIIRGDGEYTPIEDKDNPLKDRVVPIFFEATKKKLSNNKYQPVSYHHAKIWLFIYENDLGDKRSTLVIKSQNIYPYNSIEVSISFNGKKEKEIQNKNNPLVDYFKCLLPHLDDNKKEFINYLIEEVKYYHYSINNKELDSEDYEFITPICKDIPLLKKEYDEILIISPFITVESISTLLNKKKDNGRCIIITQSKIIESLILSGIKEAIYISPNISDKFIHSKLYIVRYGSTYDIYLGSMNLSDYSINKNIEAIVHLSNVKNIVDPVSFIKEHLDIDISNELKQYESDYINKSVSPIFNDAYKISTRIKYINRLLTNKKYEDDYMNEVSSYLLSSESVSDLDNLATFKKEIIPTKHVVITNKTKKRNVYKLDFKDNTLFGLFNYCLHQYDYVFSKNVYLHILEKSIDQIFVTLHETKNLKDLYLFRSDIHDFDPSMDKELLTRQIDKLFHFDPHLCKFAKSIVNESRYYLEGDNNVYRDNIIHQTGLPLGGFLENVYLYDFDYMLEKYPLYIRCGDDILIGHTSKEEIKKVSSLVKDFFKEKKLAISEHKTIIGSKDDKIVYLGWCIHNGEIDFSEQSLNSIKKMIKKKTKDLLIMYGKNKVPNTLRLPSIVRFVSHYQKSEFFITCFKRITVTDSLKKIDKMIMDLIRTVVSGKTGNSKYKIKYSSIQAFGYKSLVNQYYEYINKK